MAEASNPTQRRSQAGGRKLARRSGVWKHFTRFADVDGTAKARCNICSQVLGADTRSGTSSLWGHWRRHEQRQEMPGQSVDPAPPPQPPSPALAGAAEELARMIALRGYDPSVVEDDGFRSFLRRVSPGFQVPSRSSLAVEEMCDAIFHETRKDILSRIGDVAPGMLSLAVGTMRTVRGKVLYTACHFIDDEWKLHKVIMDAYPDLHFYDLRAGLLGVDYVCLSPHFIRSAIGKVVDDILYNRDLDNVFMMVWEIEGSHDIDRKLEKYQFIATNHTSTTYMDNVIHSIARLLTLHRDFTGEMYSDLLDLDLTRQDRHRFFSQLGLDYHHLWTYNEDWYSQYCSLEILRNKGYGYTDTLFTELLCMLWGAIYRSIQRISAPNCPTSSNLCLLQLFNLREVFRHQLAKASGEDAFAYNDSNGFHALEDGKDVADILREAMVALDKALQDFYLIWSIPLILDPRYKLVFTKSIFETAYGSQAAEYISKVQQNISELYSAYVEDQTELVCYLEDERVLDLAEGFDILSWWKVHGSVRYPTVARMARDALAMPTSSTLSSEQISHVMSIIRGYSMKGWFS